MSRHLRQRLAKIERDLHQPTTADDRQRQLADALATGTPPTDREASRRYTAACDAFTKLGGTPSDAHFSESDDGTIGGLFTVASDEEMEDARERMGLAPKPKR
jgi:hypothetical protein